MNHITESDLHRGFAMVDSQGYPVPSIDLRSRTREVAFQDVRAKVRALQKEVAAAKAKLPDDHHAALPLSTSLDRMRLCGQSEALAAVMVVLAELSCAEVRS